MSAERGGAARCLSLAQWDAHYTALKQSGLREPWYGGSLRRHVDDGGDLRLLKLQFDPSSAALRLWNFLLTEEQRLQQHRAAGKKLIGTMKDLGSVPVLAYSLPDTIAFYPDGAWWVPCLTALSDRCVAAAAAEGLGEAFCPVRAMFGAFITQSQFPRPDALICSAGATCDDFSAIAQRLHATGFEVFWWEIPARRSPDATEPCALLPGGNHAPQQQVDWVRAELQRVCERLEQVTGHAASPARLAAGIRAANQVRKVLQRLRWRVFTAPLCPLPALELLIAEMLAIHFCSDQAESLAVLSELLGEVERRVAQGIGFMPAASARIFWVNPVADLAVMNLFEQAGARLCGSDFMLTHALDEIPETLPPLEALARTALADPMVGSALDRAWRICRDAENFGAEAVVISRIPGASHCALEGSAIAALVRERLGLPTLELEVPPLSDSIMPTLRTRLEALVEAVLQRRRKVT